MAAFYGYKRWEVDQLTNEEVVMYMEQLPNIRFLRDFGMIRYQFSKFQEEDRKKMLEEATGPDDISTRAWQKFISPYLTPEKAGPRAELLHLKPETAEAIVSWVEHGGLSKYACGSEIWRRDFHSTGLWSRLLATCPTL